MTTPSIWKTAWHEAGLADRFFREMEKWEHNKELNTPEKTCFINQIAVELGHLAGYTPHGETESEGQRQLAQNRAIRLAALVAYYAAALSKPGRGKSPAPAPLQKTTTFSPAPNTPGTPQKETPAPQKAPMSLEKVVTGLSSQGLSIPEIIKMTGETPEKVRGALLQKNLPPTHSWKERPLPPKTGLH